MTYEELIRTPEYCTTRIQIELFNKVEQFIIAALEYGNVLSMMDFISSFNNEEINDEKFYIYITNNYL